MLKNAHTFHSEELEWNEICTLYLIYFVIQFDIFPFSPEEKMIQGLL